MADDAGWHHAHHGEMRRGENMYALYLYNDQGAVDGTQHQNKAAIRAEIRRWDAKKMRARVINRISGIEIYSGPALSFR